MIYKILEIISKLLALMIVLPLHEFAHAFVAVRFGDVTPKLYKRYTINPLAHFDLIGLASFALVGFGWAKPVPINPNNFKRYKLGCFCVSVAGVVANILTAFLVFPLFLLASRYVPEFGYFTYVLDCTLLLIFQFSIIFFVFNLLPFYPLDGFRVVDALSRKKGKIYCFLKNYGQIILLSLVALSLVAEFTNLYYLDVLGFVLNFFYDHISIPIVNFWGLIF